MPTEEAGGVETPAPNRLVEIHFDDRVLDHPVVPIRWCLSPEAIAYMRQHPDWDWALVIVAKKVEFRDEEAGVTRPGDPKAEVREIVEGFRAISVSHGFFRFRSAGDHDFGAFLVNSNGNSKSGFWAQVRQLRKKGGAWSRYDVSMDDLNKHPHALDRYSIRLYASDVQRVRIPEGIFAAEMNPATKRQLEFFKLGVGEDECAGRWRIGLAYSLLPAIYALFWLPLVPITRLYVLLLGLVHFLVGGNPLRVWRHMITTATILPKKLNGVFGQHDFKFMPIYEGEKNLLFLPVMFLIFIGFPALSFWLGFGWVTLSVYAVIAAIVLFFSFIGGPFLKALDKMFKEGTERKHQLVIDRVERYAICGAEQTQSTIELFWSGVKRSVCKPRQYVSS
jgi:hypothetical protein